MVPPGESFIINRSRENVHGLTNVIVPHAMLRIAVYIVV